MPDELLVDAIPHPVLIEKGADHDSEDLLDSEERAIVERLRNRKRAIEWAAARSIAKRLAVRIGVADSPAEVAVPTIGERPLMKVRGDRSPLHLSLSHSGPYYAAMITEHPAGIDLQVARPLRDGALHFFLTPREIDSVKGDADDPTRLHYWVAKEAAFKCDHEADLYTQIELELTRSSADRREFIFRGSSARGRVETVTLDDGTVIGWTCD